MNHFKIMKSKSRCAKNKKYIISIAKICLGVLLSLWGYISFYFFGNFMYIRRGCEINNETNGGLGFLQPPPSSKK